MKTPEETITELVNSRLIEEVPETAIVGQAGLVVDQMAVSMAISLKRIADTLSGQGESMFTAPINSFGEGIGSAISGQIVRGMRGDDR